VEENTVNHFFVLIGEGGNLFRQREDDVKIGNGQQLRLAVFKPLGTGERLALGTMAIPAAIVCGTFVAAGVALLQMAA